MSNDVADYFNVLVTRAILHAERLADDHAPEAALIYAQVSLYEEVLAELHPADDMEGAVARTGAVTAALRAGQYERATKLARRYVADPLLTDARRVEIADALTRLAPGGVGSPDSLKRSRAFVRSHFLEDAAEAA